MSLWEQINFVLIEKSRWLLLVEGLWATLYISFFAIIIGTLIGAIVCYLKMNNRPYLRAIGTFYITIIRGIPLATQLMIFAFVIFGKSRIQSEIVACIAFGINSGAYLAEIFRSGIQAIDIGQTEAGRSLGLNARQTMMKIIIPQAFRKVLPTYTNEFVVLVKETSIASFIAVTDLTQAGDKIRNATYNPWIPLFTVAIVYLCLTYGLSSIFTRIERRMSKSDRG